MNAISKVIAAALAVAVSCTNTGNRRTKNAVKEAFRIPQVPEMITDNEGRIEYLMDHWWDSWTPQLDSADAEVAFANWCGLSQMAELKESRRSIVKAVSKDSLRILRFAQKYLYDPNSPLRDEDIYGALAEHTGDRITAEACSLNERGTKAADFVFEDARGNRNTLYGVEAPWTILFFSNPGCHACKDIIEALSYDEKVSVAVARGIVAVVNIYIDEDLDAWREYLPAYPKKWHTGFDPLFTLRDDSVYHIRAIPSVYLLDYEKKVVLKDTSTERLLQTLNDRI